MSSLEMLERGGEKNSKKFVEILKKDPKVRVEAAAGLAQAESAAPLPRVRVQLRLLGPQTFRFIHGHRVCTQSHLSSPRRDGGRWAVAQQEGSWLADWNQSSQNWNWNWNWTAGPGVTLLLEQSPLA